VWPNTYTHRFTLEQDSDSDSDSDSEKEMGEELQQQEQQLGQRRTRYRLGRAGPLRVFGAAAEEDDEGNNIVGVTLAGDGTVLVASKVIL
jgi:NAD kinase